jgi:hypothetical protein
MQKITKEYTIYEFDELDKEAQDYAIDSLISLYIKCMPYDEMSPDMKKACTKAEEMKTPWFTGEYIWEYCEDEIMEELKRHTYYEDGKVYE